MLNFHLHLKHLWFVLLKKSPLRIPYTGRDHLVRPVLTDTRFAYRARVVVLKGYEKMSISATQNTETYYMYILKYYKFSILPAKHITTNQP
jgi:hypothetical protein